MGGVVCGVVVIVITCCSCVYARVADDEWVSATARSDLDCTPLIPKSTLRIVEGNGGAVLQLLNVQLMYSPAIFAFAANLVESLLASFGGFHGSGFPTPKDAGEFMRRAACRGDGSDTNDYGGLASVVAFDGLCIGLVEAPDHPQHSRDAQVGPRTAALGSSGYYYFLERKLDFFARVVEHHHLRRRHPVLTDREGVAVALLDWLLFMDTDAQVFWGWDRLLSRKMLCPAVALNRGNNYVTDDTGRGPDRNVVFFQRESQKLINSGVILINASDPAAPCLVRSAKQRFAPRKGGDQTAIQKSLNRARGFCITLDENQQKLPMHHSVFRRDAVNAAVIQPQKERVLIHHAHMSGGMKLSNLRNVHRIRVGVLSNATDRLHSGCFLTHPNTCPEDSLRSAVRALFRKPSGRPVADVRATNFLRAQDTDDHTLTSVSSGGSDAMVIDAPRDVLPLLELAVGSATALVLVVSIRRWRRRTVQ